MKPAKLLLLLAILVTGAALQTAVEVRQSLPWRTPGLRGFGIKLRGPARTFTDETVRQETTGLTRVRIDNAFGQVGVQAVEGSELRVELREVVYLADENRARELAQRVHVVARREGSELALGTNREEALVGPDAGVGLETHLHVLLPRGLPVEVVNTHGAVEVAETAGARVEASFDDVRLTRIAGDVQVEARHGEVQVHEAGGGLTLKARHGDVTVNGVQGTVQLDVEHGDVALSDSGAAQVDLRFGNLRAERLRAGLELRGEHNGLELVEAQGAVSVESAFRDVSARSVKGALRVLNKHGAVKIEDAGGRVQVEAAFDDVELERVAGPVEVSVNHGGVRAQELEAGLVLRSSGDDVDVLGFRGPLQLEVRRGDVRLEPRRALSEALSGSVDNGSLTLVLPPGSRGELDAQAEHGDLEIGLEVRRSRDGDAERAQGRVGEGGAPFTLRTRNGNLRVETSPDSSPH